MGKFDDLIILVIGGIATYFMLTTCMLQNALNKLPSDIIGPFADVINQVSTMVGATGCQVTGGAPTTTTTPPATVPTGTTGGGVTPTTGQQGDIYLNCTFNGGAAVQFRFDTGADFTIIRPESAQLAGIANVTPHRTQAITTATGQVNAPVVRANMSIENSQAFSAEVVILQGANFNLLSRRDLNQVYDITIGAGGTKLVPKGTAFYAVATGIALRGRIQSRYNDDMLIPLPRPQRRSYSV